MKIFQLKFSSFYIRNAIKTIVLLLLLFCCFNLDAQGERNIKLKMEVGILWSSKSNNRAYPNMSGAFFRVEPKLQTSRNTVIGLRIGLSENYHIIKGHDPNQFYVDNADFAGNAGNDALSFVPTIDYYFIDNKIRPYLGIGVGPYFFRTNTLVSRSSNIGEEMKVSVNNRIGFIVRTGLDVGKLIVGLEVNFIPNTDVEIPNGQIIGTINHSSIGLSVGYTIGSSKNSKKFKFWIF